MDHDTLLTAPSYTVYVSLIRVQTSLVQIAILVDLYTGFYNQYCGSHNILSVYILKGQLYGFLQDVERMWSEKRVFILMEIGSLRGYCIG